MNASRYIVRIDDAQKEVSVEQQGERWIVTVDGESRTVEQIVVERDQLYSLIVGDHSYLADLVAKDWDSGHFTVSTIAEQVDVQVRDELEAVAEAVAKTGSAEGLFELKSPMPGIVLRALAAPGDHVERGQGLIVLEAMKMQNELASDLAGVVQEILVEDGQMVEAGALLARVIREDA